MKQNQFTLAALAAAALLAAGCNKEAKETQLQTPAVSVSCTENSATAKVEWSDDANADCWSWKLSESADIATPVAEESSFKEHSTVFDNLKEDTEYTFSITAVAAPGSGYLNSEETTTTFRTGIIPRATAPEFKTSAVTDAGVCVTWGEVEGVTYKYRITTKADPSTTLNTDADKDFSDPFVTLAGLKASTPYIIYVQSVPAAESGLVPSSETEFEFTTEAEATEPWVAVTFEYRTFAEKNTLIVHNVPNSKAANYYTTTENVNVIGDGLDTESALANYIVWDYEDHVPGVYANTSIHKFNNNGQGWKAGDHLFYAAVGETKNGDVKLNWFWLEMPENLGDDVKILDSPDK